jgi:hypothetical protein
VDLCKESQGFFSIFCPLLIAPPMVAEYEYQH